MTNQKSKWPKAAPWMFAVIAGFVLAACGQTNNADLILSAGEFELAEPVSRSTTDSEPVMNEDDLGDGLRATCTTEGWTESEVRELSNVVGHDLTGTSLYPGALVQGKAFSEGRFVPITIPRAPGNLYMTGLILDPGAQYTKTSVAMTGGGVTQAIGELITDNGIQGTAANASYQEEQTYSYESLLFELGIDGRYGSTQMEADLSIDTTKERNFVFVKFTQVFYDVSFEDPELATSVFSDGAAFEDPEGQIGPGNPPLYVSKVSYGRMVFFVAEATHDASELQAALKAAVQGLNNVEVSADLTAEQVLNKSKIYYYVIGGDAGLSLQPIASSDNMFASVQRFIGDRNAADFSASNPGAPIAYTLNYLKDRQPARMSYFVSYDKKDCAFVQFTPPEPAAEAPKYYLEVEDLDDLEVHVVVNGKQCGNESKIARQYDLYRCLEKNSSNTVRLWARPTGVCPKVSINWYLHKQRDYDALSIGQVELPERGKSQLTNKARCDSFSWQFTINTKTDEVTNLAFRD